MHSAVDCMLEDLPETPVVRLGLRMVAGLKAASAERIAAERQAAPFDSAEELAWRASLEQHEMKPLATADAVASLSGHRRQHVWDAAHCMRRRTYCAMRRWKKTYWSYPKRPKARRSSGTTLLPT